MVFYFLGFGEFFIIYFLHKEAPKLVSLLMFIILGLVSFVVFAIEIWIPDLVSDKLSLLHINDVDCFWSACINQSDEA